ncbi:MAG TPA: GAF domain-containing protein [Actinomycetales bacterium]|nr:GAF domain-containing protein [Actinomycetales bacterium]
MSTALREHQARRALHRQRVLGVALSAGAVVAAVATYLLSAQAGQTSGSTRTWLLTLGAVTTAATIVLGAIQHRLTDRRRRTAEQVAVEAEAELALTLNGALAPITNYLGEMADAVDESERDHVAGQLTQAVVEAVVKLSPEGARSAFYRLDDNWKGLSREAWSGRPSLPRAHFEAGTPDGDAVLDLVRSGDFVIVDDVASSPMVTPSPGAGYATVAAVAVTAGSWPLGMLTVDAPVAGELDQSDVELLRVLANLLGAGLAQV